MLVVINYTKKYLFWHNHVCYHTFYPNLPIFLHRYICHICDISQLCGCWLPAKVEVQERYQAECQVPDIKCDNKEQQWLVLWWLKSSAFLATSENAGHKGCVQLGWCLSNADLSISLRCTVLLNPKCDAETRSIVFKKLL